VKSRTAVEPAFSERLAAAIADRGVSLVWLRDRLADRGDPVSLSTLSYWRSGRRNPDGVASLAAITAIEDLLGLASGELAGSIAPPARRISVPEATFPFDDGGLRAAAAETCAALRTKPTDDLRELSTHLVVEVDAGGHIRQRRTRSVLQATAGVVTELIWIEVAPAPTDVVPLLTAVIGGRPVRSLRHASGRVTGYLVEMERPLPGGTTAMVEFVVEYPPDYPPASEATHAVARRTRESVIWVRFDPDRVPDWCEEFTDDGKVPRPIELGSGSTAHVVRHGFGPGSFGIRWGLDTEGLGTQVVPMTWSRAPVPPTALPVPQSSRSTPISVCCRPLASR
jgi:hypothetical protein